MSNILAKVGKLDNVSLYQHICDTTSDLENIPENEITLGSTAIVIDGDKGFEAYMANSEKEWKPLVTMSGGGSDTPADDTSSSTVGTAVVGQATVGGASDTPSSDEQVNPGYSVETEEIVVLDNQTVGFQTEEGAPFAGIDNENYTLPEFQIPSDVEILNVTLDGVNYQLPRFNVKDFIAYGEIEDNMPSFENCPLNISGDGFIAASPSLVDNQPHTLSVSYTMPVVTDVSSAFKAAVALSVDSPIRIFDATPGPANDLRQEIDACLTNGTIPVLRYRTDSQMMVYRNFFYYFAGYEIKNYSVKAYRFTQLYALNTVTEKDIQLVCDPNNASVWTLEFVTDNEEVDPTT